MNTRANKLNSNHYDLKCDFCGKEIKNEYVERWNDMGFEGIFHCECDAERENLIIQGE